MGRLYPRCQWWRLWSFVLSVFMSSTSTIRGSVLPHGSFYSVLSTALGLLRRNCPRRHTLWRHIWMWRRRWLPGRHECRTSLTFLPSEGCFRLLLRCLCHRLPIPVQSASYCTIGTLVTGPQGCNLFFSSFITQISLPGRYETYRLYKCPIQSSKLYRIYYVFYILKSDWRSGTFW